MTVSYLEGRTLRRASLTKARLFCMRNDSPHMNMYRYCTGKCVWFNYFRILRALGKI